MGGCDILEVLLGIWGEVGVCCVRMWGGVRVDLKKGATG